MPETPWPVQILTLAPASGGTTVFRSRGELHVTVALKVVFSLVPGGDMIPADPEPIFRAELHHRDNPTRSIRATSDLAPYLPRADVLLTGQAFTPRGRPAPMQTVRLAVYRTELV